MKISVIGFRNITYTPNFQRKRRIKNKTSISIHTFRKATLNALQNGDLTISDFLLTTTFLKTITTRVCMTKAVLHM